VFSQTQIVDITDGSSNTLLLSENDVAPDGTDPANFSATAGMDNRGRIYNPGGCLLFSTLYLPNTTEPDALNYCQPIPAAPCALTSTDMNLSARSYHMGGVNAAMADGSVRFFSNTIDSQVWNALGTRSGNEPIPDSY